MTEHDPFRRAQEASEAYRRELEGLREDVRAIVQEEVERAGMPRSELERLVVEAARREAARTERTGPPWRAAGLVALGVVVGVLAGAFGYQAVAGPRGDGAGGGPEAGAAADPVAETPAPRDEPPSPPPPTAEERAARYDSLFDARSDLLEPLVAALDSGAAAAAVTEAAGVWRSGQPLSDAQRRRLHDALVQSAINAVTGSTLSLDGLLTRDPCGGRSCTALLELWRTRGGELGMPDLPASPATDTPTLAVAERTLLLGTVEASGG